MNQSSEIVFLEARLPEDQDRPAIRISSGLTDGLTQIAGITTAADNATPRPTDNVWRQLLQRLKRIGGEGCQAIQTAFSSVRSATDPSHDHNEAWPWLVILLTGSNVRRIHWNGLQNHLALIQLEKLEIGQSSRQTDAAAELNALGVVDASDHDQTPDWGTVVFDSFKVPAPEVSSLGRNGDPGSKTW